MRMVVVAVSFVASISQGHESQALGLVVSEDLAYALNKELQSIVYSSVTCSVIVDKIEFLE